MATNDRDVERMQQINEGRQRLTLGEGRAPRPGAPRAAQRSDRGRPARAPQSKSPKGHGALLAALRAEGGALLLVLNSGRKALGTVTNFDKYTVALEVEGELAVFFKHSIECMKPISPETAHD